MSLSSSGAQLLLGVPDLLLGPQSVGNVLLLLQLGGGVHGKPGGVERPRVTVRAGLARSLVAPGEHPTLAISTEGAQGTDPLTRGTHEAAVHVKTLGVNIDQLPGPDVGHLGDGQELGGAGNQGDKNTSYLGV